ncbi:SIMPL domain-containing protein [Mycetocola miduiensis]|uniref:SIMPL domain-containing protein n=1 Tax=Mycetocola miduiensis TaxID=995034 RepID=UPI000B8248F2|nr:SIMPL domain-containing protein [Mycetocola miduiensis]
MVDFSGQDDVQISVHGEGHAQSPAERATVSLAVSFDGDDRRNVRDRSAATLAVCIESIAVLHDPAAGPVVDWAADDVQVWAERPWNSEGAQLPLVYHSRAQLTATFSDVRRLSVWLEDAASQDGVNVGGITWAVTDLTRRELEARAQRDAVAHAVDKASVYAACSVSAGAHPSSCRSRRSRTRSPAGKTPGCSPWPRVPPSIWRPLPSASTSPSTCGSRRARRGYRRTRRRPTLR